MINEFDTDSEDYYSHDELINVNQDFKDVEDEKYIDLSIDEESGFINEVSWIVWKIFE